ncbi:MAG: hypothetical protein ACJ72J_19970 [Nitrososphaeraceae archaeon]
MVYQTVIEFRHVDFDKGWNRSLLGTDRVVEYTPLEDRAQLQVVTEGATGTPTTYFFEVPREEKVWVSIPENLVYIPAKCLRKQNGDNTQCLG